MGAQAEAYNIRDSVETQNRTFHYDDGITRRRIPASTSRIPFLINFALTIHKQYFRESAPNILRELNLQQEMLGNKTGISTVWRCTLTGRYDPLDIVDDRYSMTSVGRVIRYRMVYHCAVAAANALNCRNYTYLDSDQHYLEFKMAIGGMAQHNRMINKR